MREARHTGRHLRIADLTLDPDTHELRRGRAPVTLPPLSYRLLVLLVERAPHLVTHDEIVECVWEGRVVSPETVTQRVKLLRQALGDDAKRPRFIGLVRGAGYRLIADVEPIPDTPAAISPGTRARAWRLEGRLLGVGALLALAAIALVFLQLFPGSARTGDPAQASHMPLENSIAVLPFEYLGAEAATEWLGDGLAEEVLHQLTQVRDLHVIARTSSFALRDSGMDIPDIAAALGVRYVLQGSIRRFGGAIRVTAQLVDAAANSQVWSEDYDRPVDDAMGLQRDIAIQLAETLHFTLKAAQTPVVAIDPAAYRAYVRGRFFFNRRGSGDLDRAESSYRQAVETDPRIARAWVGLAATWKIRFWDNGEGDWATMIDARRDALERALEIDPDLAEAHVRMSTLLNELGDESAAEKHFQRAVELDPNDPILLQRSAFRAFSRGDFEGSIALSRKAIAVDPLTAAHHYNLGVYLLYVERGDEAAAEFDRVAELDPQDDLSFYKAFLFIQQRRYEDALAIVGRLSEPPDRQAILAMALQGLGRHAEAAAVVRELDTSAEPRAILNRAHIRARSGDARALFAALDALEQTPIDGPSTLAKIDDALVHLMIIRHAPYVRDGFSNERWNDRLGAVFKRLQRSTVESSVTVAASEAGVFPDSP